MQEAATQEIAGASPAGARPRARATLLLCLLALALSIAGWTSLGRDAFVLDRRAFWGQPWRFFAAALVHEHVVQLLVALAGIAYFGSAAERRIGPGRLLAIVGLFALGIGFAEQAFDHGSTGLTGIVFGLWALLRVGGRRNPELRSVVPLGLDLLMLAALVVCSFALPLSNWAHGAGALLGALAGLCLDARGEFRQALVPLAAALLLVLGAGATRWRASWNFGGASVEHDLAALAALERGDAPRAESELRTALRYDESNGQAWWDLGLVLERLGRHEEAAGACWRAYENMRLDREQLGYLEAVQRWALGQHYFVGEASKAFPFAKNVARLAPDDLEMWEVVRELADGLGDDEWYDRADRECARLSPRPTPEPPSQPK